MTQFKSKRDHLEKMEKLESLNSLASNKNLVLFGHNQDNLMAQIEAFKMADSEKW